MTGSIVKCLCFLLAIAIQSLPITCQSNANIVTNLTGQSQQCTDCRQSIGNQTIVTATNNATTTPATVTTESNIKLFQKQLQEQQKAITNVTLEMLKETQKRNRERIKQERVDQILEQILSRTGISNPSSNKPEVNKKVSEILSTGRTDMNGNNNGNSNNNTSRRPVMLFMPEESVQKYFSFYASCSSPVNSEPDAWYASSSDQYRIYFNVSTLSEYFKNANIRLVEARLRLSVTTAPNTNHSCNLICKSITATLYRYNRPLKRNEMENYNAVDGKMFTENHFGFVQFRLDSLVIDWLRNSSLNNGVFVKLEDEFGNSLSAMKYFSNNNCSNTNIAIPNITEFSRIQNNDRNSNQTTTYRMSSEHYPILDIITMENIFNDNQQTIYKKQILSIKNVTNFMANSGNIMQQR